MKKLIAILTAVIILASIFTINVSAETNPKEWSRMTGPASFAISPDGVSVEATEGVSFYKYTKDSVDITDFTCTFTLEQENYWDGHDGQHRYYYSLILTNKAAHSGSQGLFLLMFPTSGRSLRIEGQILNTRYLLSPTYVELDLDTTAPITMHGKVVDGTHYELTFDNCKGSYKFEIPVNYQFHTDLDGKAYFGFGATVEDEGEKAKITVTDVNGIEMSGKNATLNSNTSGNSSGSDTDIGSELLGSDIEFAEEATVDISVMTILIVALIALFVVVAAGFVILVLVINRKLSK